MTAGGINGRDGVVVVGVSNVLKKRLLVNHLRLLNDRFMTMPFKHVVAHKSEVLHRGATVLEVGIVEVLADEGLIAQDFRQWKVFEDQADDVHRKVSDGGGSGALN